MPRRGNSLSISTILKKAQRQGISTRQLADLTDRLIDIGGQRRKTVTDDVHIGVKRLLENGIRLHPFLMQDGPITPDQMEDLRPASPRSRRLSEAARMIEDLSLPSILEAPSESQGIEDLSIPNPLLEGVDTIEVQ